MYKHNTKMCKWLYITLPVSNFFGGGVEFLMYFWLYY
nr:MAG TPA_asm: hypothetical protein [Caudoviricetes sp.]